MLDYYGLDGESEPAPHSLGDSIPAGTKTPPRDMQQPERDEEKTVAYNGRGYLNAKVLNGHEQSEGNVPIAGSERDDLAAAAVGSAEEPAENKRGSR